MSDIQLDHVTDGLVVFDSGNGGLFFGQQLYKLEPRLNIDVYIDNAVHGWGSIESKDLEKRLFHLIEHIQTKTSNRIIIASHTGSVCFYNKMGRHTPESSLVKIIPGILQSIDSPICIICTETTRKSGYYQKLGSNVEVISIPGLARVIDLNLSANDLIYFLSDVFSQLKDLKPNTKVVLGCSHFSHPTVKQFIEERLTLGVIDPMEIFAKNILSEVNLPNKTKRGEFTVRKISEEENLETMLEN